MRRDRTEPWEAEAREAAEQLRQALAVLLELENAFDAGTVEDGPIFEALNMANHSKGTVCQWWQVWSEQTSNLKTSRAVPLSVYRGCLPPLVSALDIYGQSLAILALSSDLENGDRDLAGQGIKAAKGTASFALQFLADTPALRPVDRAAVDATLAGIETRSKVLIALVEPIGGRVRQLRSEVGREA